MNILLLSAGTYEYDGRLRELIKVAQLLGTTYYITRSADGVPIDNSHFVFNEDGVFDYLNFVQFCIKTAKAMSTIDVVIADNRKAIIPALWIKRKKQIRWAIQDARELYIINDVKSIQGKIGCMIEKLLNKKFEITICANNSRAHIMHDYYGLNTYPIVFENIRKLEYDAGFEKHFYDEKYKERFYPNKWRIVSTSGCSLERGTFKAVMAVGSLGPSYELYLIGQSGQKDIAVIEKVVEENGFKNIFILDPMKQNELKYFVSHCHIGLVNYHQKDFNNKYCASGKVFEFLYEGLPILATTNPPLKELCETAGVGIASEDYSNTILKLTDNYVQFKKQVLDFISLTNPESNNSNLAHKILEIIG